MFFFFWCDLFYSGWFFLKFIVIKDVDWKRWVSNICFSYEVLFLLGVEGGKYMSICEKIDERREYLILGVRKEVMNEGVKMMSWVWIVFIDVFCICNLDWLYYYFWMYFLGVIDGFKFRSMNVELGGNIKIYVCLWSYYDIYNFVFILL